MKRATPADILKERLAIRDAERAALRHAKKRDTKNHGIGRFAPRPRRVIVGRLGPEDLARMHAQKKEENGE